MGDLQHYREWNLAPIGNRWEAVEQSRRACDAAIESAQELAEIQDELSCGPGILAALRRLRG